MEGEGRREEQPKEEVEAQGATATKDKAKGHDDEDHQLVKVNMSILSPVVAVGNSEPGGGDLKEGEEGKGEGLDLEGGKNSLSPSAPPDVGSEQLDVVGAVATTDGSGSQVMEEEESSIYKLPEEIWEQILNEVKAGKDKMMCCQAVTYFDTLLTKSKPIWQFKMVFADVIEYLSFTDINNCRLVCKPWKEDIVDALFQSQVYDPDEDYLNTFRCIEDIDRCLQKFDGHPGNPFIDRVVHFDCHLPPNVDLGREQELVLKIFQFMEKFGKHIYYLRIRDLFVHPQLFYTILSRILINTPSLRGLNIDGNALNLRVNQVHNNDENAAFIIDDDYIRELDVVIHNGSLPYLPSLETLWYRQFCKCPVSLHKAIMLPYTTREKPQLKSLAIPMDCWQDEYAKGLGSLKDIIMKITCNDDLGKLLLVDNAPIEFMMLIVMSTAKISFSTLIKVLCKFPVEELQLDLPDGADLVDDDGEAAELIANMKNEKLFSLNITHESKFSYNFLKIFPSLKYLKVGLSKSLENYLEGMKESEEDVQLYKMMEESQMYESNIWSLFPDLREVEIYHFDHGQVMPQYRFVGTRAS